VSDINSYRDLKVWQNAMDIAALSYELTRDFPKDELYGMTSQIRRAAVSVAANIAEGYGRESTGNFVSFLRISQGSLKELETHLLLSARVGLTNGVLTAPLLSQCDELGKMLRAYIRSIQKSAGDQ
jgi:four helix bundle protein